MGRTGDVGYMSVVLLTAGSWPFGPASARRNGIPRMRQDHCGPFGRHEHFQRNDATTVSALGRQVPMFRWSYSIAIAE